MGLNSNKGGVNSSLTEAGSVGGERSRQVNSSLPQAGTVGGKRSRQVFSSFIRGRNLVGRKKYLYGQLSCFKHIYMVLFLWIKAVGMLE